MTETFSIAFKKNPVLQIVSAFFIIMSIWWVSIYIRGLVDTNENNYFTLIYPLLSLVGGITGFIFAKRWGGLKSHMGSALSFFSAGLLAQFFGQAAYAYYIYIQHITVPYPSVGDIGFFGSVVFYIYGVYLLAKVSGLRFSFKSIHGKILAFILPAALLLISYFFFLQGYEFDFTDKLKIFFDFGYPFGEAIYVSIALLALLMCRDLLGGVMKKPIVFLIIALVFQYICDFMFLYQSYRGLWYVGGTNDYMYFVSYFLMTVALFYIGRSFNRIQQS